MVQLIIACLIFQNSIYIVYLNTNLINVCMLFLGSKGNLKSVSMMTISESDKWEICSSSGMKYGQFVDWEKIDPEAAIRYQRILQSDHQQLKTMAREGFWAMPHTLRAKAYYHIIQSINSRLTLYNVILKTYIFCNNVKHI